MDGPLQKTLFAGKHHQSSWFDKKARSFNHRITVQQRCAGVQESTPAEVGVF